MIRSFDFFKYNLTFFNNQSIEQRGHQFINVTDAKKGKEVPHGGRSDIAGVSTLNKKVFKVFENDSILQ
jgi:hypothetical protein